MIYFLTRCIAVLFILLGGQTLWAVSWAAPEPMTQPFAYCLSTVDRCSTETLIAFDAPAPSDLRTLPGAAQSPITLVYRLPRLDSVDVSDAALLVSSGYRDHCFRFDQPSDEVFCSERQVREIDVPAQASLVFTQLVQAPDIRVVKPYFVYGSRQALQDQIMRDRMPVIGLAGWYTFLILATLAQLVTRRNQRATLSLALFGLTLLARTLVVGAYNFGSFNAFNPDVARRIELITLPLLVLFALEFYGSLIEDRFKQTRRIFQMLLLALCASILVASSPFHHFINLRLAQYLSLLGIGLIFVQVFFAAKLLDRRSQWVMLSGLVVSVVGALVDISLSLWNLPMPFGTGVFPFCFAFESFCQFVMIALRYDKAHTDAQIYQNNLMQMQAKLVNNLRHSEQELAEKVQQRTAELQAANHQIYQAFTQAEELRLQADEARQAAEQAQKQAEVSSIFAEESQEQALQAIEKLKATQAQLVQSEKMASLGLLVSNVAHEINTPIGAVKSSGAMIVDSLQDTLEQLPRLFRMLSEQESALLMRLVSNMQQQIERLTTREERAITKQLSEQLQQAGVEGATRKARLLMKFGAYHHPLDYLPLLEHTESDFVLAAAAGIADIINGANNINSAVERVSRIVFSLKELSGAERTRVQSKVILNQSIEKVIATFSAQLHDVDVVRRYQDMEPLWCEEEEVTQVWTHLIMNALQAMNHRGTLMIGLRSVDNQAEIKFADFGCGIAPENLERIFDPFYTTRTSGEGSGMGLAIVKKIVEKHRGSIVVHSEPGQGAVFTVLLPYPHH